MATPIVTLGTNLSTASGYVSGATQTSAASITYTNASAFYLENVTIHTSGLSSGTSDLFKITLDSDAGSDYDVLLLESDMKNLSTQDLLYQPDSPLLLKGGDAINVTYANTHSGGLYWAIRLVTRLS